jgi:Asp-tRNA(Asn)/Glu-tRNA(Gln) amidotransferase A subunit family amidase
MNSAPGRRKDLFSSTVEADHELIGVPVGIEFLGRPWSEPVLIRIAYAFEQATWFHRPPPGTPRLQ